MPKKIAVIDGNSLMHRAYHAVPATMNAPDGTPTNAAFGFLSMFLKFYEMARPDAVVCAFDAGRPAFRMEALEQYKAQRPPMDAELKAQFPVIEHLLESMNVPVIRVKGWEGDDVLGTVSARDEELGYETLLVSGDKDVYQLVTDRTHVVTTKKGITDVAIYGPAEVELHIAHDGRHAAARVRVFLMFGKVLQLLALELVEVVVDAVDAAVVLQKFRGGLVANAGHAGNVV